MPAASASSTFLLPPFSRSLPDAIPQLSLYPPQKQSNSQPNKAKEWGECPPPSFSPNGARSKFGKCYKEDNWLVLGGRQPFSWAAHCWQQAGPCGEGHPGCVDTPLTGVHRKGKEQPKSAAPLVGILHTRSTQYTHEESAWESARRALPSLQLGFSKSKHFLPLRWAVFFLLIVPGLNLAQVLIKTCQHLEWGPKKPVTPSASLSQAYNPSRMQFPFFTQEKEE